MKTVIIQYLKETFLFNKIRIFLNRERKISLGKNYPEVIFYVIGHTDKVGGLFWIVNKVLMHLSYAEEHNYIPIVDFKNYATQYQAEGLLHQENIWEYYFDQPTSYSLNDIASAKNIVISKKAATPSEKHFMGHFYENEAKILHFRRLYKKYIHLNIETQKYLEEVYNSIIGNKKNIIGVLCRGTDYVTKRPKDHPIPPTIEEVIDKVLQYIKEYKADYVFLATEDENIKDKFVLKFGDILLFNEQKRTSLSEVREGEYLSETRNRTIVSKEDKYVSGLQYLTAIYILSKCQYLVATQCGGTKGALIMSDGYKSTYIFNKGLYK